MDENIIDVPAIPNEENKSELAEVQQTPQPALGNAVSMLDYYSKLGNLAKSFSKSQIIPEKYQNNISDCVVAVDMACRMGVSPMMVMQNLYVVKGKPSWSGQACMTFIRNKFKKVKTIYVGEKGQDNRGCYIKAIDEDGDVLEGTTVTIAMAKAEGWYSKKDKYGNETSKWATMPEQMLAYRAAAFFARVHCPEVLMGVQVEGEVEDSQPRGKRTSEDVL